MTPWGEISGYFQDGTVTSAGELVLYDSYRDFHRIDTAPVSKDIERDMDNEGTVESFAGSEVGLFYATAYADVIAPGAVATRPVGFAGATGTACFTVDVGPLALHWNYQRSPYSGYMFPNSFSVAVYDRDTGESKGSYDILSSPFEATETLELAPGTVYVLVWGAQVSVGYGFDLSGSAQLTLDLADLGDTPSPIPAVIDVVGDAITPRTRSITCNIWPPDGYDATQIAVESIRLQGTVSPTSTSVRKGQMLVVKFPTTDLGLQPGNVELTVRGQLADGALFQGSDSITVVEKGGHK